MSIRISCPSCEASLTVDDEKAGKKIRCRKCEEVISVPAAGSKKKREEETAVQSKRNVRVKARSRDDDDEDDDEDDDDEDDRRSRKKKAKGGAPVLLLSLLGGGALLLVLIGGGIAAWVVLGKKPVEKAAPVVAQAADKGDEAKPMLGKKNPLGLQKGGNKEAAKEAAKVVADLNLGKPLPDSMSQETRERVKAAAIYVRVTLNDGRVGSGSGFLAVEPGLIVTNAHVLHMLAKNAQPPKLVECFLNSGQSNEVRMLPKIIGVDRFSDLAFLQVDNANLPAPLLIDDQRKLHEQQKVVVFGFPLGEGLGKEVTVGSAEVSALRKDKVQLQGNIQPGNSGGPVVNTAGNVIGVAVSIIEGTGLNFAVPAQNLMSAMAGHVSDSRLGQPFMENGQMRLPVKMICVDPLKRISQIKVDVWTGLPGPTRGYSQQQPTAQAGDGQRQTHTATYQGGIGTIDAPLPQPNPGQVCWVQPVFTNSRGTYWGIAVPTSTEFFAIERKPASLIANFDSQKLRTVKLKSSHGIIVTDNKDVQKTVLANKLEMEVLEELTATTPPSDKTRVRASLGQTKIMGELQGKSLGVSQPLIDLFRQFPPGYSVDKTNKLVERTIITKMNPKIDTSIRGQVLSMQEQMYNTVEAVTVPMPNKTVQPQESWQVKLPFKDTNWLDPKHKPEVIDLVVNCTFQGTRTRDSRTEGVITLSGAGQKRASKTGAGGGNTGAEITGRIGFDVNAGFISFARVKISYDLGMGPDGSQAADSLDIDLDRQAGNPLNIPMPKDPPPPIIAKGKVLFNNPNGILGLPGQPMVPSLNPSYKVAPALFQQMKLQAGKTYVITIESKDFEAYLLLKDAVGNSLFEDSSRIEFRCQQTGIYTLVLTSFNGRGGNFQFKVQEEK